MNAPDQINITAALPIGAPCQGGFYAGLINVNGRHHGLIVAPKASGEIVTQWDKDERDAPGAVSFCDGVINTNAMALAGIQCAERVLGLDIGGFKDWYIPSRDELEVIYRALKPTDQENACWSGCNVSAVPPTYPYSPNTPAQTTAKAFRNGGAEAFDDAWYWSSTQYAGSAHYAWYQTFDDGIQDYDSHHWKGRVRAVRRFSII